VEPAHEKYAVLALKNPTSGKVEFFLTRALPFGARAAVHGFNRASRALNHIVHEFGGVTTGTYFDDFPTVAPKILARKMYSRMVRLMTLLGWKLKKKNNSLKYPTDSFGCLGVQVTYTAEPRIVIANTKKRLECIEEMYEQMKEKQIASGAEIAALRGKMQFSNAQAFGRIGASAFHTLNKVDACSGPRWLSPDVREAIEWWLDAISEMPQRNMDVSDRRPPILIYSDGACEGEGWTHCTYGAVMIDPEDGTVEAFGATLGEDMQWNLSEGGQKQQLIGQVEILPMVACRIIWLVDVCFV